MTDPGQAPTRVEGLRVATLPNLLSLVRLLLIVPVLLLLARSNPGSDRIAALVLLLAGATDLLDGLLARRRGSVSPSGKVFDPLADKVLIGGLVIYLAVARGFPIWLLIAILLRDLALLLVAAFFFSRDRVVFGANWSGKATTFALGWLILAYVLRWEPGYLPLTVMATLALALSYLSYGRRGWRYATSSPWARAGERGTGMANSDRMNRSSGDDRPRKELHG